MARTLTQSKTRRATAALFAVTTPIRIPAGLSGEAMRRGAAACRDARPVSLNLVRSLRLSLHNGNFMHEGRACLYSKAINR